MRPGNQGRDIGKLLDDVPGVVLLDMNSAIQAELENHPDSPSCHCAAIEALAVLYEWGYRVVKEEK